MARIQIALGKAATLIGYSEQGMDALAQGRALDVEGSGAERRVSLQSLARFVGASADRVAVSGFRRAIEAPALWAHVFDGVPQAGSLHSAAGRTVQRAVAIAGIRQA